jgi:hypothetical protein
MADLEVSIMISNISCGGCKIECMMELAPDCPVVISSQHLPAVRAQIMWSKTGAYGCKFAKPIKEEVLVELLSAGKTLRH